ncbi:beta-N-acetylhexosaminidase [Paenibacillus sp. FJAT-26967]|uniref:beta-N-acetylhexosaminidase n=1 Tax=Paenibacillus sp. FJAT-26967 TaxID=1729690 RepID=UPI000A4F70FC|nr:beta-N-acetylhexosaminidase [Paenibacillus sp. FJAT-26967]
MNDSRVWNRGRVLLMFILLLTATSCGFLSKAPEGSGTPVPVRSSEPQQTPVPTAEDPLKEMMADMTIEQKIGQLVISGVDGVQMDEHARELIDTYRVGGFILFKPNIASAGQTVTFLNSLKTVNAEAGGKIPLFLSVDEEGGRVSRMPDSFADVPAMQVVGKTKDNRMAADVGNVLAKEISALGFNLNYAPVLDINSNPDNPVIGNRSYGTTPELVGNMGVETMKGLASQKIIPVVKHFPGHGDTSVDSHIGLPVVNYDLERLRSFELAPFAQAFKSGADAAMVAHILLPKLDKTYPASLSPAVVSGLLRKEMNFGGVIFTDDLTMGAIMKNYGIGEAAVQSVMAGTDVVLVCHEYGNTIQVIEALREAVRNGKLSENRIDESVYRVLKLKYKYTLSDTETKTPDVQKLNTEIRQTLDKYKR